MSGYHLPYILPRLYTKKGGGYTTRANCLSKQLNCAQVYREQCSI